MPRSRPLKAKIWRRLWRDSRGNIAVISAAASVVAIFGVGIGVDFTVAQGRQDKVNGIADATALYAVTPAMLSQNSGVVAAAAKAMMASQLATIPNITFSSNNINIAITDTYSGTTLVRTVNVSYTAGSNNNFAGILGMDTMPLSGAAAATSGLAPKIDFYLLLDTSPSMAIAATTSGIATMVSHTGSQGGCAFACHETDPAADNLGNPGGEDNYTLARNLGVTLRIDLVNQAVQNLMSSAASTGAQNHTTYRAGIYTIDYNFKTLTPVTANLNAAQSAAGNIQAVSVYNNGCLTPTNCNNDQDSYLDMGLSSLNTVMPAPGGGTSNVGDTPQEVVFIVSDGVIDESLNGGRVMAPINTKANWCSTIKARGIRIAFLYLTYNPLPTNSFYNANIAPWQSTIATQAQSCASPGLYFQVNTNGDVSGALNSLFQRVISTARLTQ